MLNHIYKIFFVSFAFISSVAQAHDNLPTVEINLKSLYYKPATIIETKKEITKQEIVKQKSLAKEDVKEKDAPVKTNISAKKQITKEVIVKEQSSKEIDNIIAEDAKNEEVKEVIKVKDSKVLDVKEEITVEKETTSLEIVKPVINSPEKIQQEKIIATPQEVIKTENKAIAIEPAKEDNSGTVLGIFENIVNKVTGNQEKVTDNSAAQVKQDAVIKTEKASSKEVSPSLNNTPFKPVLDPIKEEKAAQPVIQPEVKIDLPKNVIEKKEEVKIEFVQPQAVKNQEKDAKPEVNIEQKSSSKVEEKMNADLPVIPQTDNVLPLLPDLKAIDDKKDIKKQEDAAAINEVYFVKGDVVISKEMEEKLSQSIQVMKKSNDTRYKIMGYATESKKNANDDRRIALQRVIAVRKYLVDNGINPNRLNVQAIGKIDGKGNSDRVEISQVN
jgi:outer membrane protein OmpA-like peptidoglycan-associated protein